MLRLSDLHCPRARRPDCHGWSEQLAVYDCDAQKLFNFQYFHSRLRYWRRTT